MDEPVVTEDLGMSCHGLTSADDRGRAACFRREMEKIAHEYPDDLEASAFYALSLLATAPPGDPSLQQQHQAAAILEKLYATHPNHPGLAHYLIHSYDYPPLAAQGLPMARAYASIAPWVPHALHMPSHIFTRLGLWEEDIQSNVASAEAARRYAAKNYPGAMSFDELHALDYLIYAYLQTAQDAKANAVLECLNAVTRTYPEVDFAAAYAFGAIPARYALERHQWKEAAALAVRPMPFWKPMPFSEGLLVYGRGIGAAFNGDLDAARAAAARLGELSAAASEPRMRYFAMQMGQQREAALALVAFLEGNRESALATLEAVAAREDSLGKHPVSPGALFPVRELLGEVLLIDGQADRALAAFRASLKINPHRFNAVYGAARAAAAGGQRAEARGYYEELIALAASGDGTRPELAEARKFMDRE
jgi:tetratricopeptide (TPR) repeat protein